MDLAAFFAQSMFVKQVLGHAILRGTHAAQVGHPVCQFFDGLDLLVQVVCLDEITQLKKTTTKETRVLNQLRTKTYNHNQFNWKNLNDALSLLPAEIC